MGWKCALYRRVLLNSISNIAMRILHSSSAVTVCLNSIYFGGRGTVRLFLSVGTEKYIWWVSQNAELESKHKKLVVDH